MMSLLAKIELISWDKSAIKQVKPKSRWDAAKKLLDSENSLQQLKEALEAEYDDVVSGRQEGLSGKCDRRRY